MRRSNFDSDEKIVVFAKNDETCQLGTSANLQPEPKAIGFLPIQKFFNFNALNQSVLICKLPIDCEKVEDCPR